MKLVTYRLGQNEARMGVISGRLIIDVEKFGKKVNLEKKTFPGYVLVRMDLDDTTWYEIRNTPSIIGFVGSGKRPIALSRREIERILGSNEVEEVKKESPNLSQILKLVKL